MSVFTNPASRSSEDAGAYTRAILELLGSRDPIEVLRRTPSALGEQVGGMAAQDVARPEAPGKWSVRQVVMHLADSDLVWGYRVRMVLAHDRPAITGYDQDLWTERLKYAAGDEQQALRDFDVLRHSNLRLIAAASPAELQRVGVHAERGEESVAHMIRLYAGHDLLHLNQIARIRRALAQG